AGAQFLISNFIGPQLTDVLASVAAMGALVLLFQFWKPKDKFDFGHVVRAKVRHNNRDLMLAWAPYMSLVVLVLLWGYKPIQTQMNTLSIPVSWPGLHNLVQRVPPV